MKIEAKSRLTAAAKVVAAPLDLKRTKEFIKGLFNNAGLKALGLKISADKTSIEGKCDQQKLRSWSAFCATWVGLRN